MAEAGNATGGTSGIFKMLGQIFGVLLAPVNFAYSLANRGAIGASLAQGRDELKEALKAFPDSIHVAPVSIAGRGDLYGRDHDQGSVFGAMDHAPSPSQMVRDTANHPQKAEPYHDHGHDDDHAHGRS